MFGSAAVEAAYLADVLRRAHLLDGVPWSEMAVVVRSATAIGPLRRALSSVGVPVAVTADDLPLSAQPAVAPLLTALTALLPASAEGGSRVGSRRARRRGAARLGAGRCHGPRSAPHAAGGADRAGRPGHRRGRARRTTRHLLADEALLGAVPEHVVRPARRVAAVLDAGRYALADGGTAEDVLWAMWRASELAPRWARASAAGGPAGAVADRDLDAVVALFDAAAGFVDRLPSADVRAFVDAPVGAGTARPTAARRAGRGRRCGC